MRDRNRISWDKAGFIEAIGLEVKKLLQFLGFIRQAFQIGDVHNWSVYKLQTSEFSRWFFHYPFIYG